MQPLLCAQSLCVRWGGHELFSKLNFTLGAGEVVALIGASGCGKTTLLQTLAGITLPDSGSIYASGQVTTTPGYACYLPQHDSLMPWLSLIDNLLLPFKLRGVKPNLKCLDPLLAEFGLTDACALYPYQMSGGMRQRAALLRAHLSGSSLLLLDEPLSALDGITRLSMQQWLAERLWKLGSGAVVVTHDLSEALLLGDRIVVMSHKPAQLTQVACFAPRHKRFALRNSPIMLKQRQKLFSLLVPSSG